MHHELDDNHRFITIVRSIPARAAADEAFDSCRLRRIAHCSRFVWRGTIVSSGAAGNWRGTEFPVEKNNNKY